MIYPKQYVDISKTPDDAPIALRLRVYEERDLTARILLSFGDAIRMRDALISVCELLEESRRIKP